MTAILWKLIGREYQHMPKSNWGPHCLHHFQTFGICIKRLKGATLWHPAKEIRQPSTSNPQPPMALTWTSKWMLMWTWPRPHPAMKSSLLQHLVKSSNGSLDPTNQQPQQETPEIITVDGGQDSTRDGWPPARQFSNDVPPLSLNDGWGC